MLDTLFVVSALLAVATLLATIYYANSGKDRKAFVFIALLVVFGASTFYLRHTIQQRQADNDAVARDSASVQAMIEGLEWYNPYGSRNAIGDDWPLAYAPREGLAAQRPYAVIQIKNDPERTRPVYDCFLLYSEGDTITAEQLEACPTLVFCVSSTWQAERYASSTYDGFSGTSERKRLYLYDVASGAIFAEGELRASELPQSAKEEPHYTVSNGTVRKWIDEQIES